MDQIKIKRTEVDRKLTSSWLEIDQNLATKCGSYLNYIFNFRINLAVFVKRPSL